MKVFISWSGPRSGHLAVALRTWIHDVIQTVECFSSTDDIRSGQRWNNEINGELSKTDFGILCVTPENVRNPWLNFEAGALSKRIENDSRVVPVTLGFSPSALDEPLKQFNGVTADKAGITTLMRDLSAAAGVGIDIDRAVERWWSDLETQIAAIPAPEEQVDAPEPPDVAEMFTDIMASVRGLARDVRTFEHRSPSAVSSNEIIAMAHLLAESPELSEDVRAGVRGALLHLRRRARSETAEGRSRPRRAAFIPDNKLPEADDDDDGEALAEALAENGE